MWKHRRWLVTALLALTLIGYPLSIGPVMWLERRGLMPAVVARCQDVFYFPLALAVEKSEWCSSVMESYAHWWIAPPPEIRDYPTDTVP
jgi:hypothetical protein